MTDTNDLRLAIEYVLPYLVELERVEAHSNRANPTGPRNAAVCISVLRSALFKIKKGG